jgi:organic hydroperoxide reductase OsmC/OhrA
VRRRITNASVGAGPDGIFCDDERMAVKARELRFAVDLGPGVQLLDENGVRLEVPEAWTPEHLLLAALVRCSLASFDYHAKRAGIAVGETSGTGRGMVTKRESDERYAFVEIELELSVALDRAPDDLPKLLANAERDCFVGASLTVKPQYRWTVS